jgi:acyl-CoA thioester hydrolase
MGKTKNRAFFSEDGAMLAPRAQMSNTFNGQFHFFFPLMEQIRRGLGELAMLGLKCAGLSGSLPGMSPLTDVLQLRVRYSETDQMGTFYNSRALEWFECGRSELMRRKLGMSYAAMEARGWFLPLVEAHLEFQGAARYDDLLEVASSVGWSGRAKLRFEVQVRRHPSGRPVVRGWTVHAFTDGRGKPVRPPGWFVDLLKRAAAGAFPDCNAGNKGCKESPSQQTRCP